MENVFLRMRNFSWEGKGNRFVKIQPLQPWMDACWAHIALCPCHHQHKEHHYLHTQHQPAQSHISEINKLKVSRFATHASKHMRVLFLISIGLIFLMGCCLYDCKSTILLLLYCAYCSSAFNFVLVLKFYFLILIFLEVNILYIGQNWPMTPYMSL